MTAVAAPHGDTRVSRAVSPNPPEPPAAWPTRATQAPEAPAARPNAALRITNLALFQAAWFAAVLGAAHGRPLWGTAAVLAVIGWHLAVSARPAVEARLVGSACAIGLGVESGIVLLGPVAYPAGQPVAWLAPYWIVAMWGLFAIALNVTLRWLKRRPGLAATLGALAGPASFASGVQLGGARFVDAPFALLTLAVAWGLAMPLLVWLSVRFDGVAALPAPDREVAHVD